MTFCHIFLCWKTTVSEDNAYFISNNYNLFQLQSKVCELYKVLCAVAPFGTPVDTNFSSIQALINNKDIIIPQKGKVCGQCD